MLSDNYFAKVMTAERRSSGQHYRYHVAKEIIDSYSDDNHDYNIIEKSRILFDASRLLGMHKSKAKNDWKFTSINTIKLDEVAINNSDPNINELVTDTRTKIKEFKEDLFTNFDEFKSFWCKRNFETIDSYLNYFYRYIPYVKLGINDDQEVKPLVSTAKPLTLALARQQVVIRRFNDVFLKNAPKDLPDTIIESLVDFAIRTGEDNIPLEA